MAQEFLASLLKAENRVTSDPHQRCNVCFEDCDTLSAETGLMECPIRLPCSHVIGSACIRTWLRTKNNCPLCRSKFFPAQKQTPDSDDEDEENDDSSLENENLLREICVRLLADLPAPYSRVCRIDVLVEMARKVHLRIPSEGDPRRTAVALAFYMLSHIMHQRRSLVDISRASDIEALHLERTYLDIYERRESLIPEELPADNLRHTEGLSRFWDLLPPTTQSSGFTKTEEEVELVSSISEDVEMTDADTAINYLVDNGERQIRPQHFCENFCIEFGYDDDVVELCQNIAAKIHGSYLQGSGSQPRRTAAVSILVASHLAGLHTSVAFRTTVDNIASVVGVSGDTLRDDYATIYAWRGQIIDEEMLGIVASIDINRALQAVYPLSWPPPFRASIAGAESGHRVPR